MSDTSQKRAIKNYRHRLAERGMARFEVLALETDRDLIRSLAKRLADDGPEANRIRSIVSRSVEGSPPPKGGILETLRRSDGLAAHHGIDIAGGEALFFAQEVARE